MAAKRESPGKYTIAELKKMLGLTENEAEVCFINCLFFWIQKRDASYLFLDSVFSQFSVQGAAVHT